MKMDMDQPRPKWTRVAGDRHERADPKKDSPDNEEGEPDKRPESSAKEILTDPKKALYFTSMVRVLLEDRAYAVGRTPRAKLQFGAPVSHYALESALAKLETLAHAPNGGAGEITFNDDEWQALVPAFARFQVADAAVAQMDRFFPDDELMAVIDWAALQKPNWELAGLLAMPGGRADEFFPQVMKTLAFIDPDRFETIKNAFSRARRLAKGDAGILTRLRDLGAKHGIPERNLLEILDKKDNWVESLKDVLLERIRGKEGVVAGAVVNMRVKTTLALLSPWIKAYQKQAEPRQRALKEITEGMVDLLGGPGLLRATLEQVAFKPNAAPESKTAYDKLEAAQRDVNALINDKAELEKSLQMLANTNPRDWANRTDPAVSDRLAKSWLDGQYQDHLGGPVDSGAPRGGQGEGGFWQGVWRLLASFFGTAYGSSEVRSVGNRIRGLS